MSTPSSGHFEGSSSWPEDGRQRRALAAVLAVDVLDHLLAPLVLEVHVDVGRLVALPGHEALEQHLELVGAHGGDAEAVADDGVGRRAAALAEDAVAARVIDHVVHGEEEGFVAQLGDDGQLLLQQRAHLAGNAAGPVPRRALPGELRQPGGGRLAPGHQLARILVAQFLQREGAAVGNGHGRGQQLRRIQPRQLGAVAQVPLRQAVADRGEHVLQLAPPRVVHVHVAGGHRLDAQPRRQPERRLEQRGVVAIAQHRHAQPQGALVTRGQPAAVFLRAGSGGAEQPLAGQPDQQAVRGSGDAPGQVLPGEVVAALARGAAAARDQRADLAVAAPRRGQRHELQAVIEGELAADDQPGARFLRAHVGAHHAGHGALVGECQRAIAECCRAFDQLAGMRGAAQEAEVAQRMQLGVVRDAGSLPCAAGVAIRRSIHARTSAAAPRTRGRSTSARHRPRRPRSSRARSARHPTSRSGCARGR
jgi:hypothetical protein